MSIRLTMMPALVAGLFAAAPLMAQTTAATPATTPATASAPAPAAASASATHRDTMVERRITELHAKLKITPAEQKPFDDFAQAMRDNATRMDQLVSDHRTMAQTATAVDQLKAYSDMAQAHAEEVSHLVTPFSTLYAALSPEQKKMADQSFRDFANGQQGRRAAARS
jgi:protein CpxP